MSIAERRHHYQRLREQRRNYWGGAYRDRLDDRQVGIAVDTPHPRSCYMCCNPRRRGELTMQERRAKMKERDELLTIY